MGVFDRPCVVIKELANGSRIFIDLMDAYIGQAIVKDTYELSEVAFVRRVVHHGQSVVVSNATPRDVIATMHELGFDCFELEAGWIALRG